MAVLPIGFTDLDYFSDVGMRMSSVKVRVVPHRMRSGAMTDEDCIWPAQPMPDGAAFLVTSRKAPSATSAADVSSSA
ncbi:hypothetical protein [Streptomyces sp. NPDC001100]